MTTVEPLHMLPSARNYVRTFTICQSNATAKLILKASIRKTTVYTSLPFLLGGWAYYQIFKKGSLTGPQFLEGGYWDRQWSFSDGVGSFYIKNELKSEMFNDKKSLWTKMFFSIITKNLNRETLTKNLVIFQRWGGLRLKIFNIMGVHWKKQLGQFSDLRGGFREDWYSNAHYGDSTYQIWSLCKSKQFKAMRANHVINFLQIFFIFYIF